LGFMLESRAPNLVDDRGSARFRGKGAFKDQLEG
jgi:hypothetical protein